MNYQDRYSDYYSVRNTLWRACDSMVLPILLIGFAWSVYILAASLIEMIYQY